MGRVQEEFDNMHSHLKDNYKDPSGTSRDSCVRIYGVMAKLLKDEGLTPQVLIIWGEEKGIRGYRADLTPAPYEGRVTWGAHYVCASAGIVYDPMLPTPLALSEYVTSAFNQPVELEEG